MISKPLKLAHSERLGLPKITAPATLNLAITDDSFVSFAPSRAYEPAETSSFSSLLLYCLSQGWECRGADCDLNQSISKKGERKVEKKKKRKKTYPLLPI